MKIHRKFLVEPLSSVREDFDRGVLLYMVIMGVTLSVLLSIPHLASGLWPPPRLMLVVPLFMLFSLFWLYLRRKRPLAPLLFWYALLAVPSMWFLVQGHALGFGLLVLFTLGLFGPLFSVQSSPISSDGSLMPGDNHD